MEIYPRRIRASRRPGLAARAALVALVAVAACATARPAGSPVAMTEPPAAAKAAPFAPTGELDWSGGRSAAYDARAVIGPTVDVAYTGSGHWAGTFGGRDVSVQASPGRLSGPNVDLHVLRSGDRITLRGLWLGHQVWLDASPQALEGHTAADGPSFELRRSSPGFWWGDTPRGPAGLRLKGDAQRFPDVPMPQFALALLAALP